jgi:hypothetical protein
LYDLSSGASRNLHLYAVWEQVRQSDPADWLFLMYIDGDNNLQSPLRHDLNEMEAGLFRIPNDLAVSVVALWDGAGKGDSKLYELGPDTNLDEIGPYTRDVTSLAKWIEKGEVDMSSGDTLKNFLIWAKKRYAAKNIVLQFGDHGAGPRSVGSDRAMMVDDTTGRTSLMYSRDVSKAMHGALVADTSGHWRRLDLVLSDICLGASIEDAYEIYPFVKYAVVSPGNISNKGMDYTVLIGDLVPGMTVPELGGKMVADYKWEYGSVKSRGLTCIDLSRVQNVRGKVDILAGLLMDTGGAHSFPRTFVSASGVPLSLNYQDGAALLLRAQAGYAGTYTWLYDLGVFAEQMASYAAQGASGGENSGPWDEMAVAAKELTAALQSAAPYAWSSGVATAAGASNPAYDGTFLPYGITICGAPSSSAGSAGYPGWYRSDLSFGAASRWYELLEIWDSRKIWDR